MAATLLAGQVIDGWLLQEHLHTGGMAHLWTVVPAPGAGAHVLPAGCSGLPLVMKLPRMQPGDDPAGIVGFEVEQMILPALRGAHVPQFVARGDLLREPYLVMEHIAGPTLKPRLEAAPLPLDEVVDIGRSVATALHELHRQHLVHLDLKPSNLMRRSDGRVVFIDFGLSHHDRLPDLLDETFALPMGTGPYMAPEQVQFVRDDPRSDLFALGVMLYHLTTGQRPFGAPETVRALRRRLHDEPVPPRAWRADCPPWLQEVILRCLEPLPEDRWQSAAQLGLVLQDPSQLPLPDRAHRLRRRGAFRRWLRRLGSLGAAAPAPQPQGVSKALMKSPIVMAAVDIDHAEAALLAQLRETVRRLLLTESGARLACVCVLRPGRASDAGHAEDDGGASPHARQRLQLRHWARPIAATLGLDEQRLSFHVLDAGDVAAALLDFAQRNQVDHLVMGARGQSALRQHLGSVSSQVVAQAACTVTVVRA